jgi:hypothetical protein
MSDIENTEEPCGACCRMFNPYTEDYELRDGEFICEDCLNEVQNVS